MRFEPPNLGTGRIYVPSRKLAHFVEVTEAKAIDIHGCPKLAKGLCLATCSVGPLGQVVTNRHTVPIDPGDTTRDEPGQKYPAPYFGPEIGPVEPGRRSPPRQGTLSIC